MSEWRTHPLHELADIRVSNVDKKTSPTEHSVRLCNYMDVYANDYIRADLSFMEASATTAEITKFKVGRGDVLITKDSEAPDDIGIPAVVADDIDDLVCGYHLALIKPNRKLIDPVFLTKQLGTADIANYFSRYAAGSTRYGLSNGTIANTRILFPELQHQQKIATILTSIYTAIEKTEALIEKYQQIKTGLMHDLFTRGVLPNGQLRPPRDQAPELYQETAIGWIPKEWAPTSLRNLVGAANIINGPFGSDLLTSELKTEGVFVLYVQDVKPGRFSRVSSAHVTEQKANELAFCNVRTGDVLVAKVGAPPCDSCVYTLDSRAIVTQDVIRVRTPPNVNAEYLSSLLNSPIGRKSVIRISIEGTRERVSLTEFKGLVFPIAGTDEQSLIGARLEMAQTTIATALTSSEKLQRQKLGLMQDLLTGKVPVNVNTQDTAHAQ